MINHITLGGLYKTLKMKLETVSDVSGLEARRIIEQRLGFSWTDVASEPEKIIAAKDVDTINVDIQERLKGRPLSNIYGVQEFWGHDFKVNDYVLDPRPDTETIVDITVRKFKNNPPKRILDLGSGSGCLIITLLIEFPNAHGIAVDKSQNALSVAKDNACSHKVDDRLEFIKSNWWENIGGDSTFDLIVSNPPYIRESVIPDLSLEVQNHDPILALDGGKDGLEAYKKIFSQLSAHLNSGAKALFEIGFDQKKDVMRLAEESGFIVHNVHSDLAGHPRVVEISCGDK